MQHRVEEIREQSDPTHWKFVLGKLNPVALPSRGCSAEDLSNNQMEWTRVLETFRGGLSEQPQSNGIDNEEVALSEIRKTPPADVRLL